MTDRTAEGRSAHEFLAGLEDPISTLARAHGIVDASVPTRPGDTVDRFVRLVQTIVGQSISLTSAAAIFARLVALLGGQITAAALAATDDEALRQIGLSYAKARALRELARAVSTRALDLDELDTLSDDEAQARLVSLRGVGPWSAELFLMRTMQRPDVFAAGDVGLRHGIRLLDGLDAMPSIKEAAQRALAWRPYRSYAAKYLWISYDLAVLRPRST